MTPRRDDDDTVSSCVAVVVLPAYETADAIQGVIRNIAAAADAVRIYGMQLEALLVVRGDDDTEAMARKEAVAQSLPLSVEVGPLSAGSGYLHGFRRVVADVVRDFESFPKPDDSGAIHVGLAAMAIANRYRIGETPIKGRASGVDRDGSPMRRHWRGSCGCASR